MLNHIYCFISCNDFKDILDSLLERGLKQLSPGVFGLFRSSIQQMLHVITLSRKQTIVALPCIQQLCSPWRRSPHKLKILVIEPGSILQIEPVRHIKSFKHTYIGPLATKRKSSLGGQMCRNPSTKKTSERIMIVVGSDALKS